MAADSVLVPLHCEYFALEGLAELISTLRRVRAALNPGLDIEGVLLTMYDERTNLGQQVARDVRGFFKEKTFNTVIPRNVRLGEAPSHGMPVALYDVKSNGSEAYLALARELLERDRRARAAGQVTSRRPGHSAPADPAARRDNEMVDKRPALGKGLSALIPDAPEPARPGGLEVDVDLLEPNRFQPRTHVDPAGIEELARSIKANGMVQPIVVRRDGTRYQIIAGERRWRAAQHAGLLKVPVVVKEVGPGEEWRLLEWALIENIQREDLNPIEEALAFRRMMDEFDRTQDEVAEAVGKDRSSVANIAAAAAPAGRGARAGGRRRAVDGPRARAPVARRGGGDQAGGGRSCPARAVGARDRGARQADPVRAGRASDPRGRSEHARGRRTDSHGARRPGPDRAAQEGRLDRDRLLVGGRTAADLRGRHGGPLRIW